ncbi:AbrB/MazE/SpoVT family DNA-binding domain-containing protein [Haladaptatus cibarius]|uniref:AbrB/MazE/SpoVT family DNA-binding domain-containing protein n=1 Tax=Haladaptatus cibarius TaxID=453847 RepID=UPI000678906D|nr:AbrB/MazE/SpoVT family DNA-binding domain-containing protein [Haladaptatus cibarius]
METRKVQYTGSSTTISLPKEWADEHGVEAGMQLALYPAENGELIIGAEQTDDGEPPEVCVEGRSATDIRETVKALYAIGNDISRTLRSKPNESQRWSNAKRWATPRGPTSSSDSPESLDTSPSRPLTTF